MKILVPAFTLLLLVAGCKKNNADLNNCILDKVEMFNDGVLTQTTTYQYDAQKRVSKITITSAFGNTVSQFAYFADSIVITDNNNVRKSYMLDNNGRVASSRETFTPNPNALQLDYVYTYDAEGYLVQERSIFSQLYNGIIIRDTVFNSYTISNGNVVKSASSQGPYEESIEYSSELMIANNPVLNPFKSGMGSFFGKPLRNLMSRIKNQNGEVMSNISYTGTPGGKVTSMIYTSPNSTVKTTFKFSYSCN